MQASHYVLRGGVAGRERLRILSRVMWPATHSLLQRVGISPGMACLDVGCGGGDVTLELARAVGPSGRVVGMDIDGTKLELARREAEARQLGNVAFRQAAIDESDLRPEFDLAYARFLLTHLSDAPEAVRKIRLALRPGGSVIVEDTDFSGHFCHPDVPAFRRYVELYMQTVRLAGGDPNIGPRLPGMLIDAGFARVHMNVVQSAGFEGEVKFVNPLTMENMADAARAAGLVSREGADRIIADLYEAARDPRVVMSMARVIQAWGYLAAGSGN
jgi:SAM-dependent methyltransferase